VLLAVREYGCAARRDLGPLATPLGRHLPRGAGVKTYPICRSDGSLHAFEVSSSWATFGPLYRILRSIDGVTDVRRNFFGEDRISFSFLGVPCVVHEPWGDSSRYWIGPRANDDATRALDISAIHRGFQLHQGPAARLWSWLIHARSAA
jgi:hypothetical protein